MIALGLVVSASGTIGAILVGHVLFVGVFGNGALRALSSTSAACSTGGAARAGAHLVGAIRRRVVWPTLFEQAITAYGWA